MTSRIALMTVIITTLSAAGLMAQQDRSFHHRHGRQSNFVDRMSTALDLTDQQKQQARTIFMSQREAARSVRQELREERKAVESAIQAGKPVAEVEQIAKNEGPALTSLAGIRAATFAKFYAILTPAQQQKLASLRQQRRQRHAAGPEADGTASGQINSPEAGK
jgi:periplasmic protein CpxP/Spy